MTIIEALKEGENILINSNVSEAKIGAKLLLENVLNVKHAKLICMYKDEIDRKVYKKFLKCIKMRSKHMPIDYIIGIKEFMGLTFKVNKNVLVPREDTEVLVSESINALKNLNNDTNNNKENKNNDEIYNVIDMCTGSGCIALTVATKLKKTKVYSVDLSKKALKVARYNSKLNNVSNVTFVHSDLFNKFFKGNLKKKLENNVDLIISNPPYIKSDIVKELEREVRDYEPTMALDGGEDGLIFYKRIINDAKTFLKDNGILAFEIDYTYYEIIKKLFEDAGYKDIGLFKDFNGLDRVMIARKEK